MLKAIFSENKRDL